MGLAKYVLNVLQRREYGFWKCTYRHIFLSGSSDALLCVLSRFHIFTLRPRKIRGCNRATYGITLAISTCNSVDVQNKENEDDNERCVRREELRKFSHALYSV
jgi:hypothetical protein